MVGMKLNVSKLELDSVQDIQFLGIQLRLDLGRADLPDLQGSGIVLCAYSSQSHTQPGVSQCDSRPPVQAQSSDNYGMEFSSRDRDTDLRLVGISNSEQCCRQWTQPITLNSPSSCLWFMSLKHCEVVPSACVEALMQHFQAA